jgi:hypothetical protein
VPALTEAMMAWRDRYREHFESFDFFVGGGGCGIVNFPEEPALNLFYLELSFSYFCDTDTDVLTPIPGDAALAQFQGMITALSQQAVAA